MSKKNRILFIAIIVTMPFFGIVFAYESFEIWRPIDSNIFSNYGSFISGLFSVFVLLYVVLTFEETKQQSFDNTFFNLLGVHESVVQSLKSRESDIKILNTYSQNLFKGNPCSTLEGDVLKKECTSYEEKGDAGDFFEIMYRILHIEYKYSKRPLKDFFNEQNWRMGHFFRSYISIVNLVHENNQISPVKKKFYLDILKSRSSNDEIRLIFYFLIEKNNETSWKSVTSIFTSHEMFSDVENSLIWDKTSPNSDWNKFRSLNQ